MKDFARNVKECLKGSGIQEKNQTFLIVDTQLIYSLMLEYINGILKILPKSTSVGEYIINDAIITYGNLEK